MLTTTFHGRIQRERALRLAMSLVTGFALAFWHGVLQAVLDLQAAQAAHAQARRVLRETAEARALALRYATIDPGFAADLRAAVARHESTFS